MSADNRQLERRVNTIDLIERITRIEEGQKSLTALVERHLNQDCTQRGCSLHDDVIKMRASYKFVKATAVGVIVFLSGTVISKLVPLFIKP